MPERIQRRRTKGWRLPAGAICVTRGGDYGNPFEVGGWFKMGDPDPHYRGFAQMSYSRALIGGPGYTLIETREEAVAWFREYLRRHPPSEERLAKLRGHDLACFCPVDGRPCHGDVWIELANR